METSFARKTIVHMGDFARLTQKNEAYSWDQRQTARCFDSLASAGHFKLGKQACHMGFDRIGGHAKGPGDFLIALTFRQMREDFALAFGEAQRFNCLVIGHKLAARRSSCEAHSGPYAQRDEDRSDDADVDLAWH